MPIVWKGLDECLYDMCYTEFVLLDECLCDHLSCALGLGQCIIICDTESK